MKALQKAYRALDEPPTDPKIFDICMRLSLSLSLHIYKYIRYIYIYACMYAYSVYRHGLHVYI